MAVILLPFFLISIFQFGFVQRYTAHKFATYFSEKLHADVSIRNVNITYFMNFVFEDLKIMDLHQDTLLYAKAIIVDLNNLVIDKNLFTVNHVVLDNATIKLIKYKNEPDFNYQFLINYFSSTDTSSATSKNNWKILLSSLEIKKTAFVYQNQNYDFQEKGIDYNNLAVSNIYIKMRDLSLFENVIHADIKKISFQERSGFRLNNLAAVSTVSSSGIDLKKLEIKTPATNIKMDLAFIYKEYNDFNDFVERVKLKGSFSPSTVDMNDICYFAPDIEGMNNIVHLSGDVSGSVANLKGRDFNLNYNKSTQLKGNFTISGLPYLESTFIHFNVKNLSTTYSDLQTFSLPYTAKSTHLILPEEIIRLGDVRFSGAFTGFYYDFVAYGKFNTSLGDVSTDITVKRNKETRQIDYKGNLLVSNFYIGEIVSMPADFGALNLNAEVNGSGFDAENAVMSMKGVVSSLAYKNYTYRNIDIMGDLAKKKFNGFIQINDENIKLDFTGIVDYSKELPIYKMESKIENLRIAKLNLFNIKEDSISAVSSNLTLNFEGNTIDNIQGAILAENTSYMYKGETYFLNKFEFTNTAETNGNKTLKIKSDFLDADISGNFMFEDLYRSFQNFVKDYLPSYSSWIKEHIDSIPEQNFEYFIRLKNTEMLSKLLMPSLLISKNTILKGNYNTKESHLDLNLNSALTQISGTSFNDLFLKCSTADSKININLGCDQFSLSDSLSLDNITLRSVLQNDSIRYNLTWFNNDDRIKNKGDIAGFITFFQQPKIEMQFQKANLIINDSVWTINNSNSIFFDSTAVSINNLLISTQNQFVKINGTISENPADILHIGFNDFNISDIDMLSSSAGVDLDGFLSGNMELSNIYKSFNLISDFTINNLYVNKDKLGKAAVVTTWDNQEKKAYLNAEIIYEGNIGSNTPVKVVGYYYPNNKTDNFDLDIQLTNFKLKLLEKYIASFSSNLKGYASGNLKLTGTTKEPDLHGSVFAIVKGFKIDYLNENYSFTDSIKLTKNAILFNQLLINDELGGTAVLNGALTHHNFNNIKLDFAIRSSNLRCLNTNEQQNNIFYGKAFATGLIKITGDVKNIVMDVSAKTEKNTKVFIPISSESEISDNDFIHFTKRRINVDNKEEYKVDLSGFQLKFILDVTPQADVQIIFDSKIGDIIKAKGNGNLRLEITPTGDFYMYGDYIIEEGDYLFTLKNVINKKFIIQKGSSISWNGDPYIGIADITALYPVKASLSDLNGDTTSQSTKRIDVNCLLGMRDNIFNPTISFDLELPKAGEDEKNMVKNLVNTEQAMNQQIFSLLIINRFTRAGGGMFDYNTLNSGLGANSTELLSNQLSNWLSQISKDVNIGVNYRPGSELSDDELEVALSTQLFNDKLSIDGNVQTGTRKTSNIVGDVNVEYKLTNDGRFVLKGFNKSNSADLINTNSSYTQGIGIFYRREFNFIRELFKRKKKS